MHSPMMRILLVMMIISATSHLNAQKKDTCFAGVYLSERDFLNNTVSHKIDKSVEGNKLEFIMPADLTLTLKLETENSTLKFAPGEIYGYYNCGSKYRYSPGTELNAQEDYYKILEGGELVLYSSEFVSGSEIFYSLDLVSPIHRLTMKNLEKDFERFPEFMKELKSLNKRAKNGLTTLTGEGKFEINKLYREQLKKKQKAGR
jgi:hypothetical protein